MAASQAETNTTTTTAVIPNVRLQHATKTALSLALAYLIPMALGWPQPQTAATTVMLIAATGMISESLQKGVLRVVGTVAGAIIGLSLIALFPQERMLYLLAVSCIVAFIIYLYNAFQGDSTAFMLTAVVTLMVFNGGDAEGAFIYGIDRAFMTAFGVIVYTVVASMLWPIRLADNTRSMAGSLGTRYREGFERLVHNEEHQEQSRDDFLAELLTEGNAFDTHFSSVKNHADGVVNYLPEWRCVAAGYREIECLLLPALKQICNRKVEYANFIHDYEAVLTRLEAQFEMMEKAWRGEQRPSDGETLSISLNTHALREAGHLDAAAVISQIELLQKLSHMLSDILRALDSLLYDGPRFDRKTDQNRVPAFVWLDQENLKTALRAFFTFWIASAIWITVNPPGGFMFVTLCTVLIPLASFTPVTPKLLFILFSLGFLFAVPSYVFLLPLMTHWLALGIFVFAYAFLGFFVFQGPVSIFFLLGLFTLGIQNTMYYNFDALLLKVLMFYLVCAVLILSVNVPFSSKPETLYRSLRYRFFQYCAKSLRLVDGTAKFSDKVVMACLGNGAPLLEKMQIWAARINSPSLEHEDRQSLLSLNNACEILLGQLQIVALRRNEFMQNRLIKAVKRETEDNILARMCHCLAHFDKKGELKPLRNRVANIESELDHRLEDDYLERYRPEEIALFYIYLNLQVSIASSIEACRQAQQSVDWNRLGENRF